MAQGKWTVYLSGEIHSGWRGEIIEGAQASGLEVEFLSPVTDHDSSDDCGVSILGAESDTFWHDNKGAKVNAGDPAISPGSRKRPGVRSE